MRIRNIAGTPRHLSGWKKDRPDHRDHLLSASRMHPAPLPARVDLRPECSPIVDQGQLGSCTANASTSLMESLYVKIGRTPPVLSRLFLYYVTRVEVEGTADDEDSGCELRDVMKALASIGVALEATWPYDITKFGDAPPPTAFTEAKNHEITRYQRAVGLPAILAGLASGYCLVGGFSVPQNMESAECAATGIVQYPAPDEPMIGGHAVMFVGYDQATQMLTFQNSWSKDWGNGGYGYLPFAFVTNGLADDFWLLTAEMMR